MSFILVSWLVGVLAFDFAQRQVPNPWVLTGAVLAIAALAGSASPLAVTWQEALTGGASAFIILLGFYALGMMGAGDVKFAGVLGLWLGGPPLVPIAVGAGLLAGGHALFLLARRHGSALPGRRRDAAGGTNAVVAATATAGASTTGSAMNGDIPYAGYLAVMALLWVALRLAPGLTSS